jgi:hypothetical protein
MNGEHRGTIDSLIPIAYALASENGEITSNDLKEHLIDIGMDVPKPTVLGAVFKSELFRKVGFHRGGGQKLNVYAISTGEPEPEPEKEKVITWCGIPPFNYERDTKPSRLRYRV